MKENQLAVIVSVFVFLTLCPFPDRSSFFLLTGGRRLLGNSIPKLQRLYGCPLYYVSLCVCECVCVCAVLCLVAQSCPTLCNPMDCSLPGSTVHGDSLGKNTGVGCHALFQGIFPTQGWNLSLYVSALASRFITTSDTWEAPV